MWFSAERKIMNRFLNSISFTKKEIKVIVFLVSVFASGFLIKNFNHIFGSGENGIYDYTGDDNEFIKLSLNKERNSEYNAAESSESVTVDVKNLLHELLLSEDSVRKALDSVNNAKSVNIFRDPMNINTASKDELTELPGIGESTAEKIIIYREEKNGFKKTEELLNIKGIGRKKYEKLKGFIKLE